MRSETAPNSFEQAGREAGEPRQPHLVNPHAEARPRGRAPAFAFFCAYALFIVYATMLPFQFVTDPVFLRHKTCYINWNPVRLVTGEPTPIVDLVANVAFFLPLGIVGFHAQRGRRARVALLRCTAAGMLLSAGVETVQFFTPVRNTATSDVLTNTFGTLLGALAAAGFQKQLRGPLLRRTGAWMRREPLVPILAGYMLVVALSALVPFDLAPGIHWLKRAVRAARPNPWNDPSHWSSCVPQMVQYAVLCGLGFRVASRLRPGRVLRRFGDCVAAATLLALVLEVAQLAVRSRVATTRDVLAALAGSLAGVGVAVALGDGRRARHGWKLAALAFAASLGVMALQPFHFQLEWQAMMARLTPTALIPYSSYYYKANMAAVADFLEGLLGYLPLAFVLARLRSERASENGLRSGVAVVMLCALYALLLEVLQLGVPRRYPEISDVLTAGLGGALGAYAWRWLRLQKLPAILPTTAAPWAAIEPGAVAGQAPELLGGVVFGAAQAPR